MATLLTRKRHVRNALANYFPDAMFVKTRVTNPMLTMSQDDVVIEVCFINNRLHVKNTDFSFMNHPDLKPYKPFIADEGI